MPLIQRGDRAALTHLVKMRGAMERPKVRGISSSLFELTGLILETEMQKISQGLLTVLR